MELSDIKLIGNIGAGTMGHATALQFAMNGYNVNLLDTSDEALNHGMEEIRDDLKTFNKAGILKKSPEEVINRIHITTDYSKALKDVDFVIESVVEKLEVKQSVWQKVEKNIDKGTIMATNTSGLSPAAIQAVLKNPENFIVAHFWNPAQLMPLVEIVPGDKTSVETVKITQQIMNHIGKHAVSLQKESLGFVGNRIQLAVLREAFHIIREGIASPEAIDDIVKYSLGRRWSLVGPLASADLGGLDVFKNISAYLYSDLADDKGTDKLLSEMIDANRLGLKSGQGFFNWNGAEGKNMIDKRNSELLKLLKDDFDAK